MKLFQIMLVDLLTMSVGSSQFVQIEDDWNPNDLIILYLDPSSKDFQEELQFYSEQEILNLDTTGFTIDMEESILIFQEVPIIPTMMKKVGQTVVDYIEGESKVFDHTIDHIVQDVLDEIVENVLDDNMDTPYVPNDWEAELNPNSSDGDYQYPD